jgi:hypothetical protein
MTFYLLAVSAEAPIIATETAVLILAVVGLLILAKSVITLRGEVNALKGSSAATAPAVATSKRAASSPVSEEVPPQVRAAIAAAIFATLGHSHRIVTISPAQSLLWSREGRRQVFDSHRFR